MTASSEIFSRKLAGFAAYLRKQGMHVGLGEVADMAPSLIHICEGTGRGRNFPAQNRARRRGSQLRCGGCEAGGASEKRDCARKTDHGAP